jgi:hypothetical protein
MKWLQAGFLIILVIGIWIGIKIPRPYTQQFSFKKANFSGKSSRRRIFLSRLSDVFIIIGTSGQLISIFLN